MREVDRKRRASLFTIGCKLNKSDTAYLEALLVKAGYEIVPFGERADLTLINTCTVTATADFKSRQKVRQARKFNPEGIVIVTGCYAERDPGTISSQDCADLILDNHDKFKILHFLRDMRKGTPSRIPKQVELIDETESVMSEDSNDVVQHNDIVAHDVTPSYSFFTRAFIKIQDGCDEGCSYCVVPVVRGKSRSRPLDRIVTEVSRMCEKGFREIVLTGVNLGNYRDPESNEGLPDLVKTLLNSDTIPRLRLSSIEPLYFDRELVEIALGDTRLCPHFHIPLQSADPRILAAMRRGYTIKEYRGLIESIVSKIEDAAIGTDVIAGFPGEGRREFENTYAAVRDLPFSYIHVFPYSPRQETLASHFKERLDPLTLRKRATTLRDLGAEKHLQYRKKCIGRSLEVLFEREQENGDTRGVSWGISSNYVKICVPGRNYTNKLLRVQITGLTQNGLSGTVL
jgi:threonylcarbamoyladenosine tRNA methylthiotransferase MtaB